MRAAGHSLNSRAHEVGDHGRHPRRGHGFRDGPRVAPEVCAAVDVPGLAVDEPRSVAGDVCDQLRDFLKVHATGSHAEEAKKALEEGVPKIAVLLDDRAWSRAMAESCREPRASTDCDGVVQYVQDFPTGAHVDEAKQIAREAQPKLEKLVRQGK